MAIRTGKLVVNREQMAEALSRMAVKLAEATEKEIDARVKAAFETHNRARHKTPRQWFVDFLVRSRG
jgi:hypothetical protein